MPFYRPDLAKSGEFFYFFRFCPTLCSHEWRSRRVLFCLLFLMMDYYLSALADDLKIDVNLRGKYHLRMEESCKNNKDTGEIKGRIQIDLNLVEEFLKRFEKLLQIKNLIETKGEVAMEQFVNEFNSSMEILKQIFRGIDGLQELHGLDVLEYLEGYYYGYHSSRELREMKNRHGKEIPKEDEAKLSELYDEINVKTCSALKKIQKNYQIELSDVQFDEMCKKVVEIKFCNEHNDYDKYNEFVVFLENRLEAVLALMDKKLIQIGNVAMKASDNLRGRLIEDIIYELEEAGFEDSYKVEALKYVTFIKINHFNRNCILALIERAKKSYRKAEAERSWKVYDIRTLALILHPDGKVLGKDGRMMKYYSQKEVKFCVDLLIYCGSIEDDFLNEEGKYSQYKRFFEVEDLMTEAQNRLKCNAKRSKS